MDLRPIALILDRVERARSDSDIALFFELLYAGEFLLRLTTAAMVSAIEDDRERHRYRLIHTLVRSDGIGEWSRVFDDALTGPATQHLSSSAKEDRSTFTQRLGPDSWQYKAVGLLIDVLREVSGKESKEGSKLALRSWFSLFAELRNKTRGHGAPTPALCSLLCPSLEKSIKLICDNNPLFHRPWAYLHRNLSGKYRVVELGGDVSSFANFKTADAINMPQYKNGIYIYFNTPKYVELVRTNLDVSDFFFPNGDFNGKRFELHSLITDSRIDGDASPYIASASDLPESETHGLGNLDVLDEVWSNIPPVSKDYVPRRALENEINSVLLNDRHPVITLVGRGGIGKTSLAIKTLQSIAKTNRYEAIIWFSARDIDLLPTGPKTVKPRVLTEKEIAIEFVELLGLQGSVCKERTHLDIMAENLRKSSIGGPILFILDNFETVRSPVDVFQWIDANIRLPNKVMITSRFRDFKADYPLSITRIERDEAYQLIIATAQTLEVDFVITSDLKKKNIRAIRRSPVYYKGDVGGACK